MISNIIPVLLIRIRGIAINRLYSQFRRNNNIRNKRMRLTLIGNNLPNMLIRIIIMTTTRANKATLQRNIILITRRRLSILILIRTM